MIILSPEVPPVAATAEIRRVEGSSAQGGNVLSSPPTELLTGGDDLSLTDSASADVSSDQVQGWSVEQFDWRDNKVHRAFARLESKVLAGQAVAADKSLYEQMRRSRRAVNFAEQYVQAYAETHRLRMLSKKLAELDCLLRPIRLK